MYVQPNGRDQETDVVVLGTGPGGMSAVAAAVVSGAKVVAIEASVRIGGTATWSTGWIAFVNSKFQRDKGIKDSEELFVKDCEKLMSETRSICGNILDVNLVRLVGRESGKMYDRLTERGVRFTRLIKRPLQASVDRIAAIEDTNMFAEAFKTEFEGPHVTAFLNTSAQRLIIEDGAVKGVIVKPSNGGASFKVMASKGVVLATGGYGANQPLRHRYQKNSAATAPYIGLDTCRGDGQLLGQSAGGDLINMTNVPRVVLIASAIVDEVIAVNRKGERFHNEPGPYLYRVLELEKQDREEAYYIFDETTRKRMQTYVDMLEEPALQANDLKQLAKKINVPADALQKSVREWNEFLASDEDKDAYDRVTFQSDRRPMDDSPFYAARMVPGIGLTCGGLATTESMQVTNVFGEAIPGLFAVGDCAGGFTPTESMGGTHLGGALTLGWHAGTAIATGDLKPPHFKGPYGQFVPQTRALTNPQPIINISTKESGLTGKKTKKNTELKLNGYVAQVNGHA